MKIRILFIITFLSISFHLCAQEGEAIESFVNDPEFKNAGISICIRDIESGKIIAGYNENMSLTSASVMKLVTTGSALEILGPDFKYITRFGYAGRVDNGVLNGYIIIKGGGDPSLGSEYFKDHYGELISDWAQSIVDAGIRKVEGRVVADASIFAYHPAAPGWSWSDIGNYYGAGVHGLSIFDNMYSIYFKTGNEGSVPEIIGTKPEIPGLTLNNQLIASGNRDNGYVYSTPYSDYAEIKGRIPADRDTFTLKASIQDPAFLVASLINEKLEEMGVEVSDPPTTFKSYYRNFDTSLLSEVSITSITYSPPLSEIINCTNLESVNLFAETLVWTLDYVNSREESSYLKGGLNVLLSFLESGGVETSGLYMTDGSGLSRSNAASSSFLTSFLLFMEKGENSVIFKNSLAVPGKGTLEPFFKDPLFKDNLRAKSGTITRVRNYAGYMTTENGREIAFAVLSNNFDCYNSVVTNKVEKLLLEVLKRY